MALVRLLITLRDKKDGTSETLIIMNNQETGYFIKKEDCIIFYEVKD